MSLILMILIVIGMGFTMIAGAVELTYLIKFTSADYTFILTSGLILMAVINSMRSKKNDDPKL